MTDLLPIRAHALALAALLLSTASPSLAQSSAIVGKVVEIDSLAAGPCSEGCPIAEANVHVVRGDGVVARDVPTARDGSFRLDSLRPGFYTVTARRLGYRNAELGGIRLAAGQTLRIQVRLTRAPHRLSSIRVVASPISIDATTTELALHLDRELTQLIPSAPEASSLIALVPGARQDQLWGGVPGVSNDYQIDGISLNHPGIGGDLLALSADWIESLDVRGLGAGAEHGNFQGGIINAITKTGGNDRRYAIRTNYESSGLTGTNLNANEEGVEQADRTEVSGELLGPIARDRLFYFAAGQFVRRDMRSPDLTSTVGRAFQPVLEEHRDGRALGKLTWLPALGDRVDLLAGYSSFSTQHAGINGVDDPSATAADRAPSAFYEASWNVSRATNQLDVRLAGFHSRESRLGYENSGVPGVQVFQVGRTPTYQNAIFDEVREPSSLNGSVQWSARNHVLGLDQHAVIGVDVSRSHWQNELTRNGGLTWRPYTSGVANFNPFDASTWQTVGSDWGGERHIDTDDASNAVFVQDNVSIGSRLVLTPGLRFGDWQGFVRPRCTADTTTTCGRFEAVHATGWDPRLGLSWDVTGRNTFAVKAHAGRYHEKMVSLFFDRVAGANAYTNERFYYTAPPITSSGQTYTTDQRDAPGSGFGSFFDESILNESGPVEHYRQPYVDAAVLAIEKSFGTSWKAEAMYTYRRNGDIVGLVDRNLASNYTAIHNVSVDQRFVSGLVRDPSGKPLVLPVVYVANKDLQAALTAVEATAKTPPDSLLGYSADYIRQLSWNRDLVLTTLPQARRQYQQLTFVLRADRPAWRGDASVTAARLRGNVPGVTGYGTAGTEFTAGPFVRPNEGINADGALPDALELEGKIWFTAQLPFSLRGGLVFTHTSGERFTPTFQILGRYRYTRITSASGEAVPDDALRSVIGQTIFVEPRGSRQYASRDIIDAHLEWSARRWSTVTADVFNAFASNALVQVNTNIGDRDPSDPTSFYGAPRLRVQPRTLRIGLRVE